MEDFSPTPPVVKPPIQTPSRFNANTLLMPLSMFFDRLGYYGFRAIFTLYLVNEIMLERAESLSIYGTMTVLMMLLKIPGGVISDFLLGRRWSMLAGQILQMMGALSIMVPNKFGVYVAIGCLAMGSGLYTTSSWAQLGTSHFRNRRYMDIASVAMLITINIGAFIAPLLVGLASDFSFRIGFIICAASFILSGLISVIAPSKPIREFPTISETFQPKVLLYLIPMLVIPMFFWVGNEMVKDPVNNITYDAGSISWFGSVVPAYSMVAVGVTALLIFLPITGAIFFVVRANQYLKLAMGFLLLLAASYIAVMFGDSMTVSQGEEFHVNSPFFLIVLLPSIAEAIATPMFQSIIGTNAPPRIMATVFGLTMAAAYLSNTIISFIHSNIHLESLGRMVLAISCLILGMIICLIVYLLSRGMEKSEAEGYRT